MLARRLLLFASIVLLAAAFSSALTVSSRDDGDDAPALAAPLPSAGDRITGDLPSTTPVVAELGDVVELTVKAEASERVEVRALGIDAAVGPGLPATLVIVADRAGDFPVTLRYSGRKIGTLTVTDR